MNKFTALLKKDYWISKKHLLIPFWIVIGFYGLMFISSLIALISGRSPFNSFINIHTTEMDSLSPTINYFVNLVATIFSGLLTLLATISISQSSLNEDFRRNFELFHRTQPVSIWLKSLSKYTMAIAGSWIVLFIISLFNFIMINSFLVFFHQFAPKLALNGFLQGIVIYMKAILVVGSLTFFASAIFRDKAFLSGLSILIGLQVLIVVINNFFNVHIPLPLTILKRLLFIPKHYNFDSTPALNELYDVVKKGWGQIFWNIQTFYQIVVSGVLFVVSTVIYKSKEIKI